MGGIGGIRTRAVALPCALALNGCWSTSGPLTGATTASALAPASSHDALGRKADGALRSVGQRGFGMRHVTVHYYFVLSYAAVSTLYEGTAGVSLPEKGPLGIADLVWRSLPDGLYLCRIETGVEVACRKATYSDRSGEVGGLASMLDPGNRGRVLLVGESGGTVSVRGEHAKEEVYPATATGGVWLHGTVYAWCQAEGPARIPSCHPVKLEGAKLTNRNLDTPVLSVQVVRRGGELRDVMWVRSDRGVVRCEAGPSQPDPDCRVAKMN